MGWKLGAATLVLLLASAGVMAAETSGTFARYDETKKILTVKVDDKETDFPINDDVKVTTPKGEPARGGIKIFASRKIAKAGAPLTVVTATKDGKEIVTEIRLGRKIGT